MSKLSLSARVKAHVAKIGGITEGTQLLGVECLEHAMGESHDVTPLNTLYLGLSKGHHQLFADWALLHGAIVVNPLKDGRATRPFVLSTARDKDGNGKSWNIEGAKAVMWNEQGKSAGKALAESFDMQAAVKALLKRASGVCTAEQLLDLRKIAAIAHVDAAAVMIRAAKAEGVAPAAPDAVALF